MNTKTRCFKQYLVSIDYNLAGDIIADIAIILPSGFNSQLTAERAETVIAQLNASKLKVEEQNHEHRIFE